MSAFPGKLFPFRPAPPVRIHSPSFFADDEKSRLLHRSHRKYGFVESYVPQIGVRQLLPRSKSACPPISHGRTASRARPKFAVVSFRGRPRLAYDKIRVPEIRLQPVAPPCAFRRHQVRLSPGRLQPVQIPPRGNTAFPAKFDPAPAGNLLSDKLDPLPDFAQPHPRLPQTCERYPRELAPKLISFSPWAASGPGLARSVTVSPRPSKCSLPSHRIRAGSPAGPDNRRRRPTARTSSATQFSGRGICGPARQARE